MSKRTGTLSCCSVLYCWWAQQYLSQQSIWWMKEWIPWKVTFTFIITLLQSLFKNIKWLWTLLEITWSSNISWKTFIGLLEYFCAWHQLAIGCPLWDWHPTSARSVRVLIAHFPTWKIYLHPHLFFITISESTLPTQSIPQCLSPEISLSFRKVLRQDISMIKTKQLPQCFLH
jgi:hypothetical protein